MKTNSLDFDAQVLREKILDLAMRGKLVKQDPNDEPASVLLEKIKAEKAELVKEGKIKKSKALPEITDDEKPFDIPDSWEWVRLGDLFTIFNGKAFKPKDWTEKGIPIVRIQNLNNPLAEYHLYDGPIEERYHLNGNELLFAWSGTPGTSFGAHIWKDQEAVLNQHIFKLEFNQKELDKGFLKNAMNFRILKLIDDAHGSAGLRHITKKMFEETIIPLPPLSEQSRIAAKIAQLFALLRKVESSNQQYAKLQTLLKSKVLDLAMRGKLVKQDPNDEPASVLLEKIKAEKDQLIKEKKIKKSKPLPPISDEEKPFEIPDSWEWVRLGDIGEIFAGGDKPKTFSKTKDKYHTVPIYSNGIENKGLYGFTDKARVYDPAITLSARGTIGHVEYRKKPYLPIIRLISFVPYNEKCLNCIFYFLQSEILIEKGDGSSIPQLTVPKLKPKLKPFPPQSEI